MDYKELLLTMSGRISRKTYWLTVIALTVFSVVIEMLAVAIFGNGSSAATTIMVLVTLALIWPGLCIGFKRWHDRYKSSWWMLIYLVPFIGPIWALVELGFLRGTVGSNRFGNDPLAS